MANAKYAEVRSAMAAWKGQRGFVPFGNATFPDAASRSGALLANAAAILTMLSAASEDMDKLVDRGLNSEFGAHTGRGLSAALDGVGDLINLASFLLED